MIHDSRVGETGLSDSEMAGRNVERLLGVAYRPDFPDPSFERRVAANLLNAAARRGRLRQPGIAGSGGSQ